MQQRIQLTTGKHNGLFDITRNIENIVKGSNIKTGLINRYQSLTAKICKVSNSGYFSVKIQISNYDN